MKNDLYRSMTEAIVAGDRARSAALAEEAVRDGLDLLEVIEKGYVPGIQEVGRLWEEGEYFLPELITSAEAMKRAMAVLEPELARRSLKARTGGKVVIGTVEGDIHDIGKNLVASMLQAGGFEVHDLGVDVRLDRFIETAEAVGADFICLSALLTTTMTNQRRLIGCSAKRACGTSTRSSSGARRPAPSGPRRSGPTATPRTPWPPSSWPSPWPARAEEGKDRP
jgi:methanogenic corrinoid protein MtbC1